MSLVGIDFGNDTCYISVARQGGIETIANDYSLRETPSYVAFGEKSRTIGVAAKSGQMTQISRTFFGFKKLLGRKFSDPSVQSELSRVPYGIGRTEMDEVVYNINYNGENKQLSPEHLTAALFTKLKDIAETELSVKLNDVVISVPSYFTDAERRALLDSAKMAGFNVLKLMNDTTATALAYGIYKQDLPEPHKPSRNVVFVDCGHTGTQVAAGSFNKGKLTMLASGFTNSGGRNFDEEMCKYFAEDFAQRYKMQVYENKKATMKLLTECEKLKRLLAANTNKLTINIESFIDDKDVTGKMDRAMFEELISGHLADIEKVMREVLAASKLKPEEIYSVEIVGGSTRIPAIKTMIETVFGNGASTTLNADEAVSRGCALQCSILSPVFKVREFSVTDIQPYPIKLVWENTGEGQAGEMEVFPQFHPVPFSKMLTFFKSNTFQLTGEYVHNVPYPDRQIGLFEIGDVKPAEDGRSQKVKVKVRINPNGIFGVSSASLLQNRQTIDLPVRQRVQGQLSYERLQAAIREEESMKKQDKREAEGTKVAEHYGEKISQLVEDGVRELSNKIAIKESVIQTLKQNQENEKNPLVAQIERQKLKLKESERSLEIMKNYHQQQVQKEELELSSVQEELKEFKKSYKITGPDFDCPVCLDVMAPPRKIFECERGHLICEDCMKRPEIKICPTCRGPLRGRSRRNLAVERMVEDYFTKMMTS